MKRVALAALASALVAGACGDDADRRARPEPTPTPTPEPVPPAPAPAPADDAAVEPLVVLVPLETQLPANVPAVEFLGWSEDGRRFALRATHGYDMEELGGQNLLAQYQVHDALTGAMVDAYQIRRLADRSVPADDSLSLAWSQAQPANKWKAFRADTPLVGRDPAMAQGEWRLEAEAIDKPPFGSRLDVVADDARVEMRWEGFDEERLQGPARRAPALAPRVRITARRGDESFPVLTVRPRWTYEEINQARDDRDPSVTGSVLAYWSPTGDRVLLVVSHRVVGASEEHGDLADARWYVRTLGPQIKVVDGGAGAEAAHRAAARLAAAGLPVTVIEAAKQPAQSSGVYYRGSATALAERAAGALGLTGAVARLERTSGWSTLVVVLAR